MQILNPLRRIFLFLLCSSCVLAGCNGDAASGPEEGVITYSISYPKPAADAFNQKMMPDEMIMKFKNDKVLTALTFSMGFIKIDYLADNENKKLTGLTKFMNTKLAYIYTPENLDYLLKDFPPYTIEKTDETKVIAGYNCKKAIMHLKGANPYDFTVYYTDEIQIKDPNWYTPFKELNGVLMEYQVEQYDIIMRFTAKSVDLIEQDDNDFIAPHEFRLAPRVEIDSVHKMLKELNEE
ncbi:MAG: hypothetical protein ACKOXB_06975 [Flavobacteriales bacterium]